VKKKYTSYKKPTQYLKKIYEEEKLYPPLYVLRQFTATFRASQHMLRTCFLTFVSFIKTIRIVFIFRLYKLMSLWIFNKPPNANWPNNPLKTCPHPAIYLDDFNSHNQLWGYKHNDLGRNLLLEWMKLKKIHLIYHLKEERTFKSARWRKDYTCLCKW
jgi:hypothetical protein